ncbi:MAG: hypothetical protein EX272_11160 [Chromatiales bacterium]|nr:MAG: hypothetical protein EX272_11160 [Chromatiales bacterium]
MPTIVKKYSRYFRLAITLISVSACAGPDSLALERMDPLTGVTVTRAPEPMVMYRNLSGQSAFGREYVYVGPVQVNKMGQRNHFLWLGIWRTANAADPAQTIDDFETIVIYADGEPLSLEAAGWTPGAVGLSESAYVKPVASAVDGYYAVTVDQMRLIAESRDLELRAGAMQPQRYVPWDSVQEASQSMVTFLLAID